MNKVGIITLNGYFNYGNRLQNYALQEFIKMNGYECETIINKTFIDKSDSSKSDLQENKKNKFQRLLNKDFNQILSLINNKIKNKKINSINAERTKIFRDFSKKYINETSFSIEKGKVDEDLEFSTVSTKDLDKYDYIKNLFLGNILPSMWSKFIKLDFIKSNNIKFPSNISYAEDLATVSSLFMCNPKIYILSEYLYNYYQRRDSITKTKNYKVLQVDKALEFIKNRLIDENIYEIYQKEYEYMVYSHLFESCFIRYCNEKNINKKLYQYYIEKNIDINSNSYILNKISSNPLSLKIIIKSYLKSYRQGQIISFLRSIIKRDKL